MMVPGILSVVAVAFGLKTARLVLICSGPQLLAAIPRAHRERGARMQHAVTMWNSLIARSCHV